MNIRYLKLRTTVSGMEYKIPILEYKCQNPKGKVYLQSCIHGAEINGIAVIKKIQEFIEIKKPSFNFKLIPLANPYAMDNKIGEYVCGRFNLITGDNWNRGFKNLLTIPNKDSQRFNMIEFIQKNKKSGFKNTCNTFEKKLFEIINHYIRKTLPAHEKLACLLHKEALDADYCFDLHNDSLSKPYIYSPEYLKNNNLKNFNTKYFIFTSNNFTPSFNQAIFFPWWQLTYYWNKITNNKKIPPKYSFTYETGSKEILNFKLAKDIAEGIINYITKKTVNQSEYKQYGCLEKNFIKVYSKTGGILDYDFEKIGKINKATDTLGRLYTKRNIINSNTKEKEIKLKKKNILLTASSSPMLNEGDEIFKVMTEFFTF